MPNHVPITDPQPTWTEQCRAALMVTGDCPLCGRGWVTDFMHGVCDGCARRGEREQQRVKDRAC